MIIDGAGIGSSIAANKVPGIRAALCYDRASARNSREHNDSNVLDAWRAAADGQPGGRRSAHLAGDSFRRRQAHGAGREDCGDRAASMAGERSLTVAAHTRPAAAASRDASGSVRPDGRADRSHHAAAGSHPRGYRQAVRRGAPIWLRHGVHQSVLGAAGGQRTGGVGSEGLHGGGISAGRHQPPRPKWPKPPRPCVRARARSIW